MPDWDSERDIVYHVRSNDNGTDIYSMTSTGGNAIQLTTGEFRESLPRRSPDGTKLAYVSNASGEQQVWLRDLQSALDVQLTTRGGTWPSWAPDGRRLAYAAAANGDSTGGVIWIIDTETFEERQLTRPWPQYCPS
jgi:TolB protein